MIPTTSETWAFEQPAHNEPQHCRLYATKRGVAEPRHALTWLVLGSR